MKILSGPLLCRHLAQPQVSWGDSDSRQPAPAVVLYTDTSSAEACRLSTFTFPPTAEQARMSPAGSAEHLLDHMRACAQASIALPCSKAAEGWQPLAQCSVPSAWTGACRSHVVC